MYGYPDPMYHLTKLQINLIVCSYHPEDMFGNRSKHINVCVRLDAVVDETEEWP